MMLWVITFLMVIMVDSATPASRPVVLGLFLFCLIMAAWCSWAEDKRQQK